MVDAWTNVPISGSNSTEPTSVSHPPPTSSPSGKGKGKAKQEDEEMEEDSHPEDDEEDDEEEDDDEEEEEDDDDEVSTNHELAVALSRSPKRAILCLTRFYLVFARFALRGRVDRHM